MPTNNETNRFWLSHIFESFKPNYDNECIALMSKMNSENKYIKIHSQEHCEMRLAVRTQSVDTSILNTGIMLRKNYVNVSKTNKKKELQPWELCGCNKQYSSYMWKTY